MWILVPASCGGAGAQQGRDAERTEKNFDGHERSPDRNTARERGGGVAPTKLLRRGGIASNTSYARSALSTARCSGGSGVEDWSEGRAALIGPLEPNRM